jgi:mono/diheme cytochrome c family protein
MAGGLPPTPFGASNVNQPAKKLWMCTLMIAWLLSAVTPAFAQESLTYETHVRPILTQHCLACHGPAKQMSSLRLDRKNSAMLGGDFGEPAIVAGKSTDSPLVQYISDPNHSNAMPPPGEGRRRLNDEEVDTIRRWIDQGAVWDDDIASIEEEMNHWSYRPLAHQFEYDSIDAFLEATRLQKGLVPSSAAPPHAIARRLSFALIGLPPEPTQVQQFVNEFSKNEENAVEQLVDRLLASPHYGERWARHWLDVVRFAESDGFEMNHPRPNSWPYRDYVIDAFNRDLPYDVFIREQLAGDRWGVEAATGFLVGGPWDRVKSPDPVLTANQRADELHDMVSTTASAFLGLTVGCARCHAHKFDPITQQDYYRIKACLSGVQHGERPLSRSVAESQRSEIDASIAKSQQIRQQLRQLEPCAHPGSNTPVRAPVSHRENVENFEPTSARWVRFEILATTGAEPCIDEFEILSNDDVNLASTASVTSSGDFPNNSFHQLAHVNDGRYGNERSWISNEIGKGWLVFDLGKEVSIHRVLWSRDRSPEPRYSDRVATQYTLSVSSDGETWSVIADASDRRDRSEGASTAGPEESLRTELRSLEQKIQSFRAGPQVYAGKMGVPEPVYRFHRGDPMAPKEAIAPGGLTSFGGFELALDSSDLDRRVALAEWIASPSHPLTARVIVNRLWHYHFGTGLVETPSDFGKGGGVPSHPELLDWLAVQFIEQGWSMKKLQRMICTSQTYRLDSRPTGASKRYDQSNRWLCYFPPRRLEAEPLRDTILSVCGELDGTVGGPGFDLFEPNENYVRVYETKTEYGEAEFRRMVYQRKPRVELDQIFGTFDCPDAGQIQPKRNVSTTPLQALNLLNSRFMIDRSQAMAARLEREANGSPERQIERAYELLFSRTPTLEEGTLCLELIDQHGLEALCRALFNANEFIMVY